MPCSSHRCSFAVLCCLSVVLSSASKNQQYASWIYGFNLHIFSISLTLHAVAEIILGVWVYPTWVVTSNFSSKRRINRFGERKESRKYKVTHLNGHILFCWLAKRMEWFSFCSLQAAVVHTYLSPSKTSRTCAASPTRPAERPGTAGLSLVLEMNLLKLFPPCLA